MSYVLGIDIGVGTVRAAVCRRAAGREGWGPAQPLALGARSPQVAAALRMTADGTVVPAEVGQFPADAVRGYLNRVGDPLPMFFAGGYFPAHGLTAAMARWVVDRAWELMGEAPLRVALAHPSSWGDGRLGLLRAGLDEADLPGAVLVTRARAIVECHQAAGRAPTGGGLLGVYRLGGSTAEVALVAPQQPGRIELLASAELTDAGGFEVDGLSPADARAVLRPTVDLTAALVRSRGYGPEDLTAVLLAGAGGAAGDHVSELLGVVFPAPVVRDPQPHTTVAAGAALAGRPAVRPTAPALVGPTDAFAVLPATAPPEIARNRGAAGECPPRPPVNRVPVRAEN
ncbi:hypothetical protein [Actinoplanes derwentensis]|uniref:Hsp70 protein n=1 Tax=Actinoplanes derwentensis TaxID=113562 RepID=A0A1H2DEN6_9ACTN|nr:hypothetical protein [Actinoplanes derwentensis]GID84845.1 hypothetical protein Ade03nite_37690 [Actinoplanes derwentensis]SDT80962.1 hypothetical protein SAMN04489716_9436 [Actinoplanes derwentensis]